MEIDLNDTYITKFNINNKPLYLKLTWKEDDKDLFHMQVFYDDKSWAGMFTNELAAQRRQRFNETVDEFNKNVKECLTQNNNNYVYDFFYNSNCLIPASFVWKKRYEGALKMYGLVPLIFEVSFSKDTLIDILLEKNKKYILDIDVANKANNSLKEELKQCTHKLEELIESKSSMESTLYGSFTQVLNKKKERIQALEEQINTL